MNDHICLSGGADGSDLEWGMCATALGHRVIHFSFPDHRTDAPPDTLHRLTIAQLMASDAACLKANLSLQRKFPAKSSHTTNLLRRDWYQVATTSSCYAVSYMKPTPRRTTINLGEVISGDVNGGTAWAVQMFIDRHDGQACPCYFFDQKMCHWFQWVGSGWQCIYEPPKPTGEYTGVGIRFISPLGRLAIRVLMDYARKSDAPSAQVQAEQMARRKFEERSRLMEGHKMGSWESLPEMMKQALIHHEMTKH